MIMREFLFRIINNHCLEHARTPPPPPKNNKNAGFPSKTDPDPLNNQKGMRSSIQCWAIVGTPAAADSGIWILPPLKKQQ